MKVISVLGGLGSQMFKYAFYLSLKQKTREKCFIDTSFFVPVDAVDRYELKKVFGINDPDFIDFYDKNSLEELSKSRHNYPKMNIDIMLRDGDLDYYFMGKKFHFKKSRHNFPFIFKFRKLLYLKYVLGMPYKCKSYVFENFIDERNIYFDEFPHNSDIHFADCSELVKNAFVFPEFDDEKNMNVRNEMENCESVSVHVRRTDHSTDNSRLFKNGFYKKAISRIRKDSTEKPVFFVFSDDLEWVKANATSLGFLDSDKIVYVNWNKGLDSYKDMQLMTYCQHNIVPISSFSWWGYYLSKRKNKIVIAPKKYWDEIKIHY